MVRAFSHISHLLGNGGESPDVATVPIKQ
jgi:hypothetical protein